MKSCALYTRVSTEHQANQEFSSCDAQNARIKSYIASQEGWELFKEYSDPGFTAANTDRPGLTELLGDIKQGKVKVVLTYKIDRLSRSLLDFYSLMKYFEKYGVSYVSVTEHFDTSTASGRLFLNILMIFAQFERELIAERTRDKLSQRAQKGMANGGVTPYGYRRQNKTIVIDAIKGRHVREIFETFSATASFKEVMEVVRKRNIVNAAKNDFMTLPAIHNILRNPVYTGKVRWKKDIYKGEHEAIISEEVFDLVQGLFGKKIRQKRLYKKFLFGGLIKCSECGSTMTSSFTNKKTRRYYYYKCTKVSKHGVEACSIRQVNSERLEEFIIDYFSRIASDNQYVEACVLKYFKQSGADSGVEPTPECSKSLENSILETLGEFKTKVNTNAQSDRAHIISETFKKITYHPEFLEVLIYIGDRNDSSAADELQSLRAAGGGRPNLKRKTPHSSSECGVGVLTKPGHCRTRTYDLFDVNEAL